MDSYSNSHPSYSNPSYSRSTLRSTQINKPHSCTCAGFLHTVLLIFCNCFLIVGILLLIAAILFQNHFYPVLALESIDKNEVPWIGQYVIIASGALLFLIALCGCCATVHGGKKTSFVLEFFFWISFLLLFISSSWHIVAYLDIYKSHSINAALRRTINNYGEDEVVTRSFDYIQREFECCGVESYRDWDDTPWGKKHKHQEPESCSPTSRTVFPSFIYHTGCQEVIEKDLRTYLFPIVIGLSVTTALMFVTGLFIGALRRQREIQAFRPHLMFSPSYVFTSSSAPPSQAESAPLLDDSRQQTSV